MDGTKIGQKNNQNYRFYIQDDIFGEEYLDYLFTLEDKRGPISVLVKKIQEDFVAMGYNKDIKKEEGKVTFVFSGKYDFEVSVMKTKDNDILKIIFMTPIQDNLTKLLGIELYNFFSKLEYKEIVGFLGEYRKKLGTIEEKKVDNKSPSMDEIIRDAGNKILKEGGHESFVF